MTRRQKSAKRLGLLAAALVGLGLAAGVAVHRKHQHEAADYKHLRTDAMTAYRAGDYAAAVEQLDRYLVNYDTDDDAGLAYAIARSKVELPAGQHLRKAIDKLDQILQRHTDSLAARHALLEILPQTGDVDRMEQLAAETLAQEPHDAAAISTRIALRMRQDRLEEALGYAKLYSDLKPDDFQARITVLHLMTRLQKPAAEVKSYVDAQYAKTPDEPRRLLLDAIAVSYTDDAKGAFALLRQAATRPSNDAAFIQQLANLFDLLHQFDDSTKLLEEAATRTGDPAILNALVMRMWQQGQFERIAQRLSGLSADAKTDASLLGLKAIALYQTNQPEAAHAIVEQLRSRKDRKALAWVTALGTRYGGGNNAVATIAALNAALARDPDNGIFKTWLAAGYATIGESALALRSWSGASLQMPGWSTPYVGMSEALTQLGRYDEAVQAAQSAFDRRPTTAAAVNLAASRYRALATPLEPAAGHALLDWIDRVHAMSPDEVSILPMQVDLLARLDEREKAIAILEQASTRAPRYDDQTLSLLARVSRANGLGYEDRLLVLAPIEQAQPDLLLARATTLAEANRAAEGAALLTQRLAAASSSEKVGWDLALSQFFEVTRDPQASASWHKLADAYPNALDVQQAVLQLGASARMDRAFIDRTIERLKALTGEQGQQWKLERARWLIESPDVMKDCIEAVSILSDIIRESPKQIIPRRELARALERTGNVTGAIEHLKVAQSIDAANVPVASDLVRLYQSQGRSEDVRQTLQRLVTRARLSPPEQIKVAALSLSAGMPQQAIDVLSASNADSLPPAGRVLLAVAYRQANQPEQATKIFDALLTDPNAAPATLASAAEFYASQQHAERARSVLARLAKSNAAPLDIALASARFEERFGDSATTLIRYRDAAATNTEAGWTALIDYQLRTQSPDSAAVSAQRARAAFPDSKVLVDRVTEAKALSLQQRNPKNLAPLIEVLSHDPARTAEVETLRALSAAQESALPPADLLAKLRAVADRYPCYVPLQEQLVNSYLKIGRGDDAVTVARRLMDALPADAAAARLATQSLRAIQRWSEMRTAAEQWKARTVGDALDADTAIAEARLHLNQSAEALQQLEPYRERLATDARSQPQAAFVLARAMATLAQDAAAQSLLSPLLQDAVGRRMWRSIARDDASSLASAGTWCAIVEKATPPNAWEERSAALAAYASIGRRFDDTQTLIATIDRANAYLAERPGDTDTQFLVAGLNQQLGKSTEAETSLRALLKTLPDHAAANNDLACLLLAQNRSLDEALSRAHSATRLAPSAAAFQDTLARVLMAMHQNADARKAFESALRLDASLVEARVGLARLLKELGQEDAARNELRRAQTEVDSHPRTGRGVQDEMTSLRAALTSEP